MKYENPRQVITLHLPKDPVRCFNYALQYCAKIVEECDSSEEALRKILDSKI